jgi:ribosomal protein S18 acetylase RimI-like enzyme
VQIRRFDTHDTESVVALWRDCHLTVPWNDPYKDIARKLEVGADLFLVGTLNDVVIASVMGGYEGHRGWINYLAVHPTQQRKGFASQLVQAVEQSLLTLGCPKLNLQVRQGNNAVQAFYESLGYSDDNAMSMGKRLIPDD